MKLVAIKSFSYNTRRLNPGDLFEAKDPDGRLLVGVLKARKLEDRNEKEIPAPKKEVLEKLNKNKLFTGGIIYTTNNLSFISEKPSETFVSSEKIENLTKTPVEETPVEETPVEETPVEETPVEETPVEETPVEVVPQTNRTRGRKRKN